MKRTHLGPSESSASSGPPSDEQWSSFLGKFVTRVNRRGTLSLV